MAELLILALAGTCAGIVGGGLTAGTSGMIVGGSTGLMTGSLIWALTSTALQMRRERRLNRYFRQDFWGD
ncbi:MAG: hypothetical protein H6642_09735 [Caldilineaceae bacterium]|nr:hypothetical protein [Caldilineaceae bacterium]